jgi:hypothetical protein
LRQRKDGTGEKGYSVFTMSEYSEILNMSVADVLKSTPATTKFFISQHTDCVGCRLARFCTMEDVIKTYEFDEEKYLQELSKYILNQNLIRSTE